MSGCVKTKFKIKIEMSGTITLVSGIREGSVLGPIFFIIKAEVKSQPESGLQVVITTMREDGRDQFI